MRLKYL